MESKQNLRILTAKHTCKNKLTTLTVIYLGKKLSVTAAALPYRMRNEPLVKKEKVCKSSFSKEFLSLESQLGRHSSLPRHNPKILSKEEKKRVALEECMLIFEII